MVTWPCSAIDVATGRTVQRLSISTNLNQRVSFSPDGGTLAVAGGHNSGFFRRRTSVGRALVHLIDVRSNRVRRTERLDMVITGELGFLSRGQVVVGGAMSAGLHVVPRAPGKPVRVVRGAYYQQALAISRDGKLVAVTDGTPRLTLRDPRTWKVKRVLTGAIGGTTGQAFSPRGRYLVALGRDGSVRMFRIR